MDIQSKDGGADGGGRGRPGAGDSGGRSRRCLSGWRAALGGGVRSRRLSVRPQTGDKVLVVKAGDQREIPCLAGVRQPEIQEKEDPLEAGAVRITGGSGQMDLNTKGVVLNGKETALKGRVTVNGERLEDMIWRIAADVVSSMLG